MSDISTLAATTTTISAISNLVIVSPQSTVGYVPQVNGSTSGMPGPYLANNVASANQLAGPPSTLSGILPAAQPALVFNYEGEQTVMIESDITDHWIENNTVIQDQIALKPEVITTHGFVGELNDIAPSFLRPLQVLADKLTVISAYVPVISTTAQIAYDEAFFAYQVAYNAANSAISTISSLQNIGGGSVGGETVIGNQGLTYQKNQTQQQVAFQQFYAYWSQRILFTVQTPWAVFQNMAIKSLRAIQDAETTVITDFEVTFKRIRTVSSISESLQVVQARLAAQAASNVTTGNGSLSPVELNIASAFVGL